MQVKFYRTYRFKDKDPVIDAMRTIIQQEHIKQAAAAQISGLAAATLQNWFHGETRNPQNSSITAFTSSLGYVRRDELDKNGHVHVGYVRARMIDVAAEREKGVKFAEKMERLRPKKKKSKSNGA